MKCERCNKPEMQTNAYGKKKKIKHPANVTAIICSSCVTEDLTNSRRRRE